MSETIGDYDRRTYGADVCDAFNAKAFASRVADARLTLTAPEMSAVIRGVDGELVFVVRGDSSLLPDLLRMGDEGIAVNFVTVEPPVNPATAG